MWNLQFPYLSQLWERLIHPICFQQYFVRMSGKNILRLQESCTMYLASKYTRKSSFPFSPKISNSLGLFIIFNRMFYHKHRKVMVSNTVFLMFLQCWYSNPGLSTYQTSILLLSHSASLGLFESGSLLCSKAGWNTQPSYLHLSGAGERDRGHHANCWLILQSAQHWELLSEFERIKMWFSFYVNMYLDREVHSPYITWSLSQRAGLPFET